MTNFFGAHAAIHSTLWLSADSLFAITGLLKALAARSLASLLLPHSALDMDESLTHEGRLFSAFMDNLPAFAWIKDLEGRYVYLNKLALKHLAPFPNEWFKKTDAELWPGEIGATYRANDLKVVASRETLETVETCVVEGEQRHLLVSKFPILDHAGAVIMVGSIGADITGHQRAENALREAEKKYRDIFENAVEGIFQSTPDGHFITANPALARMLGYESPEELLSSRTDIARQHYVEPADRLRFQQVLEEDGVIRDFEHRAYRKDGHKIWLSENVRSVCDVNGVVLYYEGFTEDITERKCAEESLKLFRNLIDRSSDAIEVLEPSTLRFLDCNTTAHQSLGYTREEFLSLSAFDIDPIIDESMLAQLAEEMDKSAFAIFESVHRRKDGSTFPVEINAKTIRLERDYRLAVVRDITERKLIEEALRESEERYRVVTETASEAIITIDESSAILFVNPATEQIFGYSAKEMLGEQLTMLMPEYLRHVHEAGLNRYAETGRKHISWQGTELPGLHKSKQEIPLEVSFSDAIQNGHHYFTGIARDVTNRKRTEEALKQSEQDFRNLFEQAHDAIIVLNPENEIVLDVNERACEVYGFSRLEFIGMSLDAISKDVIRGKNKIAQTLEQGDYLNFETVQYRKDGSEMFLEINASTILYQGQLVILSINRDVTERKRAEAALRESEERYRELFENAKDTIYVHDLNGVYTSVNRAAEQLTGYSCEEIIGKHFSDFLAPEYLPRVRNHLHKRLTDQRPTSFEVEVIARDGRRVPVELSSNLVCEDGVPIGVQGIARDITERKRAAELLQTFPRRLIEAQEEERKRIARELHDEIGQVLTAISLNLQAVRASGLTPTSTPKIDESILVVDDALHHVQNLALELRPSLLDDLGLEAAIRWFVDRYTQRTGIKVEVTMDAQMADGRLSREFETACFRIVQEGLTNVARHAEAQTVSVHLRALSDETCISIKDDGVGFDASAGNGATPLRLGLRGMEERALALGGKLEIKSAPARGTEIRAHFPNEEKRTRP